MNNKCNFDDGVNKVYSYQKNIENKLWIEFEINELYNLFLNYVNKKESYTIDNEIDSLKSIKRFLHDEKDKYHKIMDDTRLKWSNCLISSITTSLLMNRIGYQVEIWYPDKIIKHFHSFIITTDWKIFKTSGRDRNYWIKRLTSDNVIKRLNLINPLINNIRLMCENITKAKT